MKAKFLIALALVTVLSLMMMTTASAALPTGLSWVKYASNPVAPFNLCGVATPVRPAIVVDSPNNYKMYFTTQPTDGMGIYLATSSNGGNSWTCATANTPVLTVGASGAWDAVRVMTPAVISDGGTYKMWYTGKNAAGVYNIGYAYSTDGINWTKNSGTGGPVLTVGTPGAWDGQYVREASVVKVGTTYHMWYSGTAKWPYFKIGHATSSDGITWAKDAANPVLAPTANSWDANETYSPSVVLNNSTFEMFYSGNAGGKWLVGHASSPDGSVWAKDGNPIIGPSATGWDNGDSTDYAAAVYDGSWKVFYSGAGNATGYQIGLATLQNTPQLTFTPLATNVDIGAQVTLNIDLTSVTNLYGYQFEVNYDPNAVSANGSFVTTWFNTNTVYLRITTDSTNGFMG